MAGALTQPTEVAAAHECRSPYPQIRGQLDQESRSSRPLRSPTVIVMAESATGVETTHDFKE
jgi:hypothetical protein